MNSSSFLSIWHCYRLNIQLIRLAYIVSHFSILTHDEVKFLCEGVLNYSSQKILKAKEQGVLKIPVLFHISHPHELVQTNLHLICHSQKFLGMFLYVFHFHNQYFFLILHLNLFLWYPQSTNSFLSLFLYHNLYLILYRKGLHITVGKIFFVPMRVHLKDIQPFV